MSVEAMMLPPSVRLPLPLKQAPVADILHFNDSRHVPPPFR